MVSHFRFNIHLLPVSETGASSQYMNDYHRKPSIGVSNEAQKQCSNADRNLSYVFDDHRLEQSREPKKTEKSTYYTKYNYDWNGPKVSCLSLISYPTIISRKAYDRSTENIRSSDFETIRSLR